MKLIILILFLMSAVRTLAGNEDVVLLHGLVRTSLSMKKLERSLEKEGYRVANIGYKSRSACIEELAVVVRESIVESSPGEGPIHVVTHSMGGIILRQIQKTDPLPRLGRVVMIAPPNHGSEVVDILGDTWYFKALNGPAGQQLGTDSEGFIAGLGPVDFELGVIAGDRTMDPIFSRLIPGKNDGKVSVESAKVEGMKELLVVRAGHTFIMSRPPVVEATIRFLRTGAFAAAEE